MSEPAAGALVREADLSDFDWADADLTEAVFVDCRMAYVAFTGTVLQGARFERCRLPRARFARADLRESVFTDCQFVEPGGAHDGATFAFSRLEDARFERCDLSFARLERSDAANLVLEDCNLRGARFDRVDFTRLLGRRRIEPRGAFRRCNFHLADLSGLILPGGEFTGSRMREADLSAADLEGADLREADLYASTLTGAKLAGADLRGGEVGGVDLSVLATREGLKVTLEQQYDLLTALGVDVHAA